jgi:hypothetical protein
MIDLIQYPESGRNYKLSKAFSKSFPATAQKSVSSNSWSLTTAAKNA